MTNESSNKYAQSLCNSQAIWQIKRHIPSMALQIMALGDTMPGDFATNMKTAIDVIINDYASITCSTNLIADEINEQIALSQIEVFLLRSELAARNTQTERANDK